MKLKTKVFLKKKYAMFMNVVIRILKLRPIRFLCSYILKKRASPDLYLSAYKLICQIESIENLITITSAIHKRFPDKQTVTDKLNGLILENNEVDRAYNLSKESCERQVANIAREVKSDYEDQVGNSVLGEFVQISGYFYSGSGAVLDHLKGYSDAIKWTPHGEIHIIKFPGGLSELYNNLEKNGYLTKKDLVRFYLHIRAGFYVDSGAVEYKRENVVNRFSQKMLNSPSASLYIYELLRLWNDLNAFSMQNEQNISDYVSIVQTGLSRAFNAVLYQNNAKILVCDQMVTAWRLPTARLLPPSKFIIVHRDPRDQFVESNLVKGMPGRKKQSVAQYSKVYENRRTLTDEWIPKLESEYGHEFLKIAFEDFVIHNEESVKKIRNHLSLDKKDFDKEKTRFDPNVSIKNIGKYKDSLDDGEIEYIEKQLAQYIYNED